MLRFKSMEEAEEAGVPVSIDGSAITLKQANKIGEIADLAMSREIRLTDKGAVKLAVRVFKRTYEEIRGAWRERQVVNLGGRSKLAITRTGSTPRE